MDKWRHNGYTTDTQWINGDTMDKWRQWINGDTMDKWRQWINGDTMDTQWIHNG